MHQTGSRIWTNIFDNASNWLRETARSDFWDFNMQQSVRRDFVIHRGDRLNTHCIFNTKDRTGLTTFGEGSEQEMCMDFLTYYPALFTVADEAYSFCGISQNWGEPTLRSVSVCGNYDQVLSPLIPSTASATTSRTRWSGRAKPRPPLASVRCPRL